MDSFLRLLTWAVELWSGSRSASGRTAWGLWFLSSWLFFRVNPWWWKILLLLLDCYLWIRRFFRVRPDGGTYSTAGGCWFFIILWAPCVRTAWLILRYGWLTSSLELDPFKARPSGGLIPRHFLGCKISPEIRSEINLDLVQHLLFLRYLSKGYWPRRDASGCIEGVLWLLEIWFPETMLESRRYLYVQF